MREKDRKLRRRRQRRKKRLKQQNRAQQASAKPVKKKSTRRPAKSAAEKKPATKARKGINPFTKEPTVFKAKPATKVVKVRPVKAAKDAVG